MIATSAQNLHGKMIQYCSEQSQPPVDPPRGAAAVALLSWAIVCMTPVTALQAVQRLRRSNLRTIVLILSAGLDCLSHSLLEAIINLKRWLESAICR